VDVLYVNPKSVDLKEGQRVEAGRTPIGTAQDITQTFPPTKMGP